MENFYFFGGKLYFKVLNMPVRCHKKIQPLDRLSIFKRNFINIIIAATLKLFSVFFFANIDAISLTVIIYEDDKNTRMGFELY